MCPIVESKAHGAGATAGRSAVGGRWQLSEAPAAGRPAAAGAPSRPPWHCSRVLRTDQALPQLLKCLPKQHHVPAGRVPQQPDRQALGV